VEPNFVPWQRYDSIEWHEMSSSQEEFAQIVHKLKRLRGQQREAERQGEYLFQTLLDRAFGGELGPQNPNDEATRKEPGGAERRGSQRPRQLELL
jgi:hypothetical protein